MSSIESGLLNFFLFLPLFGAFVVLLIPKNSGRLPAWVSLFISLLNFAVGLYFYFNYFPEVYFFYKKTWISSIGLNYSLYMDGLALMLSLLTALLTPISILSSFSSINKETNWYYASLLTLETSVIGVFLASDMLLFYVFWEAMLIPMYFLIGIWGGERKIYAAVKFFIYTMSASLLMLAAIIMMFIYSKNYSGIASFSIFDFQNIKMASAAANFCFFSFLIAFAVKIPIIPLHTWLPDAHVEAPTAASVMLAGVLLKMGIYGFLRFLVPIFPDLSVRYSPYIAILGSLAAIYASLAAWVQKDLKKMIAYSSVAHMGIIVLGLMSFNPTASTGAVLQSLNHGITTGALFLLVGVIYERRHTRLLSDFGGLFSITPVFASFFMISMLSSIALPGLNGFVGEFMIFSGSFSSYPLLTAAAVSGVIFSSLYMLSAYEKIFYGPVSNPQNASLKDLNLREKLYLLPLVALMLYIGLYPSAFTRKFERSVEKYCVSVIGLERQ